MGKLTVHFRCHHTGHCCKDVICLPTPADVIRIIRETGANPFKFLEFITPDDITGVNKNDPTWLEVGSDRYMMALRRDKKGCFFLDPKTRFCRIYDARPLLCRLYPFKLQEDREGNFRGFTLHTDVGCPRHRDGAMDTAPLYALYREDATNQEDYRVLVAAFNKKHYPEKQPEDFLAGFLEIVRGKKGKGRGKV